MRTESESHIELHLTIIAKLEQDPNAKLLKAAKELAVLIEQNCGLVKADS
jgi:hypothetical protein